MIFSWKDVGKKKAQQVQMMQRLTKQQEELVEFIAKTEKLVLKIGTKADLSQSDIMVVKVLMNQWCEEEKKKMIREDKEQKEKEKREKKEAESDEKKKRKGKKEKRKKKKKG